MADFLEDAQENIASGQDRIMASRKFIRNQAKGITDELDNEKRITRLDTMLRRAEKNSDKFRIEMPKNIIPIMANEEISQVKKAVGSEINVEINISRIIENAAKRKE